MGQCCNADMLLVEDSAGQRPPIKKFTRRFDLGNVAEHICY